MEFRTIVNIPHPAFKIEPCERILFVGSCFADNIGKRFQEEQFRAMVNPFGVMYNPVSVLHTVKKMENCNFDTAMFTLGTNHVYVERATGEIVDNCKKRPHRLFEERELTIEECSDASARLSHYYNKPILRSGLSSLSVQSVMPNTATTEVSCRRQYYCWLPTN